MLFWLIIMVTNFEKYEWLGKTELSWQLCDIIIYGKKTSAFTNFRLRTWKKFLLMKSNYFIVYIILVYDWDVF